MLEIEIKDLSRGGAGVGKLPSGKTVFIPYTAPGDVVSVKLTEEAERYAWAEVIEILKPGPSRVTPKCVVFGSCGGCEWQHVDYPTQWKIKSAGSLQALKRAKIEMGEISPELFPSTTLWNYRNRVQLRGLENKIGFFEKETRDLVSIERCEIANEKINEVLAEIREKGKSFSSEYKVEVEVRDGKVNYLFNQRHAALGFRQIHDEQNELLKNWIKDMILDSVKKMNLSAFDLIDLYGGNGNLSLPLASSASRIDCIDLSAPLERPENTPENVYFYAQDTVEWLKKNSSSNSLSLENPPTFAIIDPPREGLVGFFDRIENSLCSLSTQAVIAVGCDADAWARDVRRFIERDWKLSKVALFDFFPQTPHIESAALLTHPAFKP